MSEVGVTPKGRSRSAALLTALSLGAAFSVSMPAAAAPAAGPAADIDRHVRAAEALANDDLKPAVSFLCSADQPALVKDGLLNGARQWLAPTRLFDNIFYIGSRFVGVLVVKTSDGLILFDSETSATEVEQYLLPGLQALGLDPHAIRYVIVTHGHWDHFGGAAYLQQTFGARVGLSAADWDMIEHAPPDSPGVSGHPPPRRDLVLADGQSLTLGDTHITLYLTPGHTPGTVSAIVPGREGGKTYPLSLYGSFAFPAGVEPTDRYGGLRLYRTSVERFAGISRAAGAVGVLNTHVFGDGGVARLQAAQARGAGQPNPFLIGPAAVARYYALTDECLQAAELRLNAAATH